MKVGSLVELINDEWDPRDYALETARGVRYPVKGKIYTVRGIYDGTDAGDVAPFYLYLEELVNAKYLYGNGVYGEPCFNGLRFRELMGPISIDIEELMSVPA